MDEVVIVELTKRVEELDHRLVVAESKLRATRRLVWTLVMGLALLVLTIVVPAFASVGIILAFLVVLVAVAGLIGTGLRKMLPGLAGPE